MKEYIKPTLFCLTALSLCAFLGLGYDQSGIVYIPNPPTSFDIVGGASEGIGTSSPAASAMLDIVSTTLGARPMPSMTTTQKNAISSPAEGLWVYDLTLHAPYFWNASAWTPASGGGVTSVTGTSPIVSSGGSTPAISLSGVTAEQGNGSKVQLSTGTTVNNDCVKYDANGNAIDAGVTCGGGGGMFTYSDNGVTLTANTYFMPPGGGGIPQTTEANVDIASPSATTVSNLQVGVSAAPGAGNSYTITFRDAGADTTLTCTISGASATSCSDTTHSVSVAKNDLIDWKIVSAGTIITTPTLTIASSNGTSGVGVTAVTATAPVVSSGGTTPNISCPTCATTSGALTLISTQTASSSANLSWTGLGSSYNTYFLDCAVVSASSSVTLLLQFGEGGTPTWNTSGYFYSNYGVNSTNAGGTAGGEAGTGIFLNNGAFQQASAPYTVSSKHYISNVPSTTLYKMVTGNFGDWYATTPHASWGFSGGSYTGDTNAVTALRVQFSSGNIASGQCSLYGMTP